jgi:putative flavoprotein involved in K+ transport
MSDSIDAVVIGAGQAGLAASHHLSRRGIGHVVLERGRVGETWRTQRWDSFALNTPRWMSRQPGEPAELADNERDAFLSASAWVKCLEAAAAADNAPILQQTRVTGVSPDPTGGFVVTANGPDGPVERHTRAVLAASGSMNVARVPAFATSLPSHVEQLTAATYRRPGDLPAGAVVVVGGAQSGVQIAEDLVLAGRTVFLATSPVGRLRRRYRGRDSMEWLIHAGWWDLTPETLPDPRMQTWPNPQTSGLGPLGHTVSLQGLEAQGVRLLGRPTSVTGARLMLEDSLGAAIAFGDQHSSEFIAEMERAIEAGGFDAPPPEPDAGDVPHPDPSSVHSPPHLDLDREGISTVIWTTGFGGDFGYLPGAALDANGRPLHKHGVASVPGIYFTGVPWLVKRRSGVIFGLEEGGALVADQVAASLEGT